VIFAKRAYESLREHMLCDSSERSAWLFGREAGRSIVVEEVLCEYNRANSPRHVVPNLRYAPEYEEVLRDRGFDDALVGAAHSHPGGRSRPSGGDKDCWSE
jgi:proteasome lid subunit RPN8/RPN11